ncbi:MAG: helix-turn-helix domain-containing protein [Clostridiales bacterium]|nr:helix-turn-helix domain-containing protein [Clostridiales bacterium]
MRSGEIQRTNDLRPNAERKAPANKLSAEERQAVIKTVNKPEYASMPSCELVPALADEGIYIGSESTIYRILREENVDSDRYNPSARKN